MADDNFDPTDVPNYINSADNHGYGNDNFAFTDPTTWSNAPENLAKFSVVAAASGLNSFYNTGVAVANWFGADVKENNLGASLADVDSDLGKYYSEHRQSADLVGFIASSFVPGLGGIKVLNAAQKTLRIAADTGMVGTTLSRATGLLSPATDMYRSLAATEIAQSSATFSAINGNTLKAIASGYGQAALEGAAFEVAVTATQFKSPVLDDADGWDIAKNVMMGAGVNGVIAGAFTHAATMGFIKAGVKDVNPAEKMFTAGSDEILNLDSLTPSQRIIAAQQRLDQMPTAPTAAEFQAGKFADGTPLSDEYAGTQKLLASLPSSEADAAATGMATKFSRLQSDTEQKLNNSIRSSMQELAKGKDPELANQLADMMDGVALHQTTANFEHLAQYGRVGQKLDVEASIARDIKNSLDIATGAKEPEAANSSIGFVKLTGEDVGKFSPDTPKVLNIADTSTNVDDVLKTVQGYKFKDGKIWSALDDKVTHTQAEARGIWADRFASTSNGMTIGEHDIPLLEKASELFDRSKQMLGADGNAVPVTVKLQAADKSITEVTSPEELFQHLQLAKDEVVGARQISPAGLGVTNEELSKIANVKVSYIEGDHSTDVASDLFARQGAKAAYVKNLRDNNLYTSTLDSNYGLTPSYLKTAYVTHDLQGIDGNVLKGMAYVKAKGKLYQQSIDNVVANQLPTGFFDRLWHPTDETLLGANRIGGSAGVASNANGNYNSIGAWSQAIGGVAQDLKQAFKAATQEKLNPIAYKLANNQDAAIEFSAFNKKMRSTEEMYKWNAEGDALIPKQIADYNDTVRNLKPGENPPDFPKLQEGAELEIRFKNQECEDAVRARMELTGARQQGYTDVQNAQGLTNGRDPGVYRPIRENLNDYPHFAIVVDPTVTGVGQKSMLHAASEKELEAMIDKVPDRFQVYKKSQMEEYHRAQGDFDYEQTLHENYIDASLKSEGIDNPFFVKTDPQKIAQDWLNDHLRSDDIFVKELLNAKYQKEFDYLRQQGEQYTSAATSKYLSSARQVEKTLDNPYTNIAKQALDISLVSEHPYIYGMNTYLDKGFSKIMDTVRSAFGNATKPSDLEAVNTLLDKHGVSSAYYDTATQLLANHSAPKGDLAKFVRSANSILTNLTLRLDPVNALNNALGANVLYGTETASVLRAIGRNDADAAGALSKLTELQLPGVNTPIRTAGRLYQQALKNWIDSEATTSSGELLGDFYKRNGFDVSIRNQFNSIQNELALTGSESSGVLSQKVANAFATAQKISAVGEKVTGNSYAESFNRFIAADTMRQLTDVGVAAGHISEGEALGYINTFVNRTQGNIIASQRPLMFQGPIGQAVGLFQSYQFNLLQQMFRHVAEGAPKDTAMLLGLQGTLYGMNGLPAFNAINTHILGTMSGNPQHTDAYSATLGAAGKSIGDLLLYGLPSSMLQCNIYTRGDINPRQVTVIPTNIADVPIVSAFTKSLLNVQDTLKKMGDGGSVWSTFLQGVEHNGISRPMAGLAQVAEGLTNGGTSYSTTSKGSISYSNDLLSYANAVRLVGGKPLDEGITNDAVFRFSAYAAADHAKMQTLGEAVKASVIAGGTPSEGQIGSFVRQYAAAGGNQLQFNKFMLGQIKSANTSQANVIMSHLQRPGAQSFQEVMGGRNAPDGNSITGGTSLD